MASFFRLITHVVDVENDEDVLTLAVTDAAAAAVVVSVTSWAIPQAGTPDDGEAPADTVTSRQSSHVQHHAIGDSR